MHHYDPDSRYLIPPHVPEVPLEAAVVDETVDALRCLELGPLDVLMLEEALERSGRG